MIVSSFSNGSGDNNSGSVDSLPYIASIDSPGHLFDEHWGQSLGPQGLVHAQEVDFWNNLFLSIDDNMDGYP